ncbi:CoA pyrophosphatase [Ketobacter sp.]|uniref:CoA pyrophosphatase n=1 Tax=Ketobacter sp. TaxID=2083498 RepID=UPI000F26A940|nr:CoA pyrophosphatase [Ketobacter sp.]RLT94516.1 MAG: CoA pyrophosphatase [Ketobacter sp.]
MDWLSRIRSQAPLHHPGERALSEAEAAVLIAITDHGNAPEVVLTRRADHLSSHAGEVAFPGGKCDPEDESVFATALRESYEEVQLPPDQVELVGPMPFSVSKMGLKVVPVIGIIPHQLELVASEDEIHSIFRVPLQYFLETPPPDFTEKEYQGVRYRIPCYNYDGYVIWGLTAYFITDCFNRIFDTGFELRMPQLQTPNATQ